MRFMTVFFSVLVLGANAASAGDMYVTTRVNLRAGPDGGYPVVRILKPDQRVEVNGCLKDRTWCEVEVGNKIRGWIYAPYLRPPAPRSGYTIIETSPYGSRVIIFRPNDYWDRYYRDEYFYKDRYKWIPRDTHHHNDDDDNDHGHHWPKPPVIAPQPKPEPAPPKYKKMEMPGNSKYNPLCPMGVSDC